MSRKQFTTEKIIGMLREADVALAQGMKVGETPCSILAALGSARQCSIRILNRYWSRPISYSLVWWIP
jgi:hypothetical protein